MLLRSWIINPNDNVAVLLEPGHKGDTIDANGEIITLLEDVEFAHKVLILDSEPMTPIYKYGEEIGYLPLATPKGTWVHNHIMSCDRGK